MRACVLAISAVVNSAKGRSECGLLQAHWKTIDDRQAPTIASISDPWT
jgi:hypothetical protein